MRNLIKKPVPDPDLGKGGRGWGGGGDGGVGAESSRLLHKGKTIFTIMHTV